MIRAITTASALALALVACSRPGTPAAPSELNLAADLRTTEPKPREGECWASDTTPAVIETVTEQVMVAPAELAPDGSVLTPAAFHTETRQSIVRERAQVWFRTPCPADQTVEFVATLQRALKARGYYLAPVTGTLDPSTREAVRRFQEPLGLDSPELSLEAARRLGIVAADPDAL